MLGILANRLGRIVDRARFLEGKLNSIEETKRNRAFDELERLSSRARRDHLRHHLRSAHLRYDSDPIYGHFFAVNLSKPITVLFIAAMVSLFLALVTFLREVISATRGLRIGTRPQPRVKTR